MAERTLHYALICPKLTEVQHLNQRNPPPTSNPLPHDNVSKAGVVATLWSSYILHIGETLPLVIQMNQGSEGLKV